MTIRRCGTKAGRACAIVTFLLIICCKGETMSGERMKIGSIDEVSPSSWDALAQRKVFFGHQSVGDNIIVGMEEIMKERPGVRLDIRKTKKPENFGNAVFGHFAIGKNEDPATKIHDFDAIMRSGVAGRVDIALFKFCFVDITGSTDAGKLFEDYAHAMASLKTAYPGVAFVHVTVPLLRREKASPKAWLLRLLGKGDGFFADEHNVRRNEFNDLMRAAYAGREPLFDLAAFESTHPDGSRETFTDRGRTCSALAPEYTEDGGHLNALGRRMVAGQFLIFLAGIR